MKRILSVVVLTLALNFLLAAGGVGYLFATGKLDRERVRAIRSVVSGSDEPAVAVETTPELEQPTEPDDPVKRLEAMLADASGRTARTAAEQLASRDAAVDARAAEFGRAARELADLKQQVASARRVVETDRALVDDARDRLQERAAEADRLAADAGFRKTLALYSGLPSRQVKSIFLALPPADAARYLNAMDARAAAKVAREFKSADEVARLQQMMDAIALPGNTPVSLDAAGDGKPGAATLTPPERPTALVE